MICVWAAPPMLSLAGLRAISWVNTRNSGFACDQHTMPDTVVPKTQTTLPLTALFRRFSPRWSAMWAPHHLEPRTRRRQAGGIAPCKGATRRRHAVRRLRMAQNPHRYQYRARCRGGRARLGRRWVAETRQLHTPSGATAKQISPSTSRTAQLPVQNSPSTPPRTACAGQNSPCTPLLTACAVQNSPCTPALAAFPV